ncbi:adenylate/guanylate cyclase domain-containing protein [bacterium]|nr:adenylate/guanylate cyclase domain-containing protein [bacterium]
MKKNYRLTFFRHLLIPFSLIAVISSIFMSNFLLAFLVNNSSAVEIAKKSGKSISREIDKLLITDSIIYREKNSKATITVSTESGKNSKGPKAGFHIRGSKNRAFVVVGCMIILLTTLYLWIRPFLLFLQSGDEKYRGKAIYIYENFYNGVFLYILVNEILNLLLSYDIFDFSKMILIIIPYTIVRILINCYFLYLYIEPLLFIYVGKSMYSDDEIFKFKNKKTITIYSKLLLMLFILIILPMIMILIYISRDYFVLDVYKYSAISLIITMILLIIGNMQLLYKSIQEPLNRLGEKMTELASGNFDDYTTVLSNDEVGVLKGNFNLMVDQLKEREQIKETFGKYVSVEIAKKLLEEKEINLGGENIEATVLFSDIRNFTTMSERMTPEDVVSFLNSYFSFITEPIMENNGVINKFIGDAVMAIFTPLLGSENHVDDAVKAVIGMRKKLKEYNASGNMDVEIRFGVGLNMGVLVAGNIGTDKRLEYTVIGDTVNVAARLESETKNCKCDIIISESTYEGLSEKLKNDLIVNKINDLKLKGKEKPIIAYKI